MALTTEQQLLIETKVANDSKSTGVAYALWFFLGGLGGHRFYLGQTGTAITMLILFVLGWATIVVGVGIVFFLIVGVWAIVDAFLIPGMIREDKDKLRAQLSASTTASA